MAPSAEEQLNAIWLGGVLPRYSVGGFTRLSDADRSFWLVWLARAEIDNGGFDQLTTNDIGEHAALLPGAFEAVGLPDAARVLRQYVDLLVGNGHVAPTTTGRMKQLGRAYRRHGDPALVRRFDRLADKFYSLEERLEVKLLSYARKHGLAGRGSDSPAVRRQATKLRRAEQLRRRRILDFIRRGRSSRSPRR